MLLYITFMVWKKLMTFEVFVKGTCQLSFIYLYIGCSKGKTYHLFCLASATHSYEWCHYCKYSNKCWSTDITNADLNYRYAPHMHTPNYLYFFRQKYMMNNIVQTKHRMLCISTVSHHS